MTSPRIPSTTHAASVGTALTAVPLLVSAAVSAIPLFADRPLLSICVSVAIAAVLIAAVLRWGYAVYRGWKNPSEQGPPCASDTDCTDDDEDVSEVQSK